MDNSFSRLNSNRNLRIDPENLCEPYSAMIELVSCQVCQNIVFPQPVCCALCKKMLCKKCSDILIRKKKQCVNFHVYSEGQINPTAKSLLDKILLKCPNYRNGCRVQIRYANYLRHVDSECAYEEYTCHGCNFIGIKSNKIYHENSCDLIEKNCAYCHNAFRKRDLPFHTQNCEMRTFDCKFCYKVFRKPDNINHENNCDEQTITCAYCEQCFKRKYEYLHTKDVCFKEFRSKFNHRNSLITENTTLKNDYDDIICQVTR